ncbi:hypothetical protein C4568_00810 [Candidatus Parcubacteria bacterium]|nr:MAG: hypothetical protein C4568_00810 [Candidatus Parcubacteria bacterium]
MEDNLLQQRLDVLERKIDAVYASAEKTRKYFLAVLIISIIAFVLPLIGLVFAVPTFLSTYSSLESLQGI